MYLSKSTLRINIRRTVKKLETILILERKKEKKKEVTKERKKEVKKEKDKEKEKKKKKKVALTSTLKRFALTSTLTLAAQTSMCTNVDFNVGRTNVAAALTSIAQTSMRTNVDAQKRRVALSSVAQNSRHQFLYQWISCLFFCSGFRDQQIVPFGKQCPNLQTFCSIIWPSLLLSIFLLVN
jgi:hypothetical protein